MRPTAVLLLLLFSSFSLQAQKDGPALPDGVFPWHFEKQDSAWNQYLLTVAFQNKTSPTDSGFIPPVAMVLDPDGNLCWYSRKPDALPGDLKYFPAQKKFGLICYRNPAHTDYYLLDSNMQIVDSIGNTNGLESDAHEFLYLPDGHYIIAGAHDTVMDLRGQKFHIYPGEDSTVVVCYVIQEFDSNHKLVFSWNSIDHIPPSEDYVYLYGYNRRKFDYCHGNAIATDSDGNLLVSFRNLNAVYKIDRKSGRIIWQLGGKHNSFRFVNDKGFSGQHDIRALPGGIISLFDNSTALPDEKGTRAVEYRIDAAGHTAERVYEYRYKPELYSASLGSYQHGEKYRLINYGFVFRPDPSITVIDEHNRPAVQVFFRDSIKAYRSYFSDAGKMIRRPKVFAERAGNRIRLKAETGFKNYRWSTGDTTQTILVDSAGYFQVWVDCGIGRAGSRAVHVIDPRKGIVTGAIGPENENLLLLLLLGGTGLVVAAVLLTGGQKTEKTG